MRGSPRCRVHSGLHAAAVAEAERLGRPIIVIRQSRKRALEKLGKGPMPDDFPWRPDFNDLGPIARVDLRGVVEPPHGAGDLAAFDADAISTPKVRP